MAVHQEKLELRTTGRGLHEITAEVAAIVQRSPIRTGNAVVFCQHTSCSLVIMENADPSARADLEAYFERLAPDADPRYSHTAEGADDMSAHLRMVLTRTSETIPIGDRSLLMGTWQGIFLWEHRASPSRRVIVVTVSGG